ncbi:MAG: hypothetical protein R3A80_06595 [Bdellovibrionota bacterium]
MFKHSGYILVLAFLLASCVSSKKALLSERNKVLGERWFLGTEKIEKGAKNPGDIPSLSVQYDTYFTFSPNKLVKTTVCHFKQPVDKMLIVDTESPVIFGPNSFTVLLPSSQKQTYDAVLAPKSGKGPSIKRAVYCSSSLEAKSYNYELQGEELILKPVGEILKLKKYKQE